MKTKLLLTSLLALACVLAFGQDDDRKKPNEGDFSAEVNFNPFSSTPVNINYLRGRYFISDLSAFRIGFALGFQNDTPDRDVTLNTVEFNLRPGYEWHFAGTERLSPYFGFEIDYALKTSKYTNDDEDEVIKEIKGAWNTNGTERGYSRIGANLIIGADFYVAKRLYIGTEFGYGFQKITDADIKVTTTDNDTETLRGGSLTQMGSNFNSSLRLGFVF